MSCEELYIAGTRTFAGEVSDFARDANLSVAGLLEPTDPANMGKRIHGLPVRALEDAPAHSAAIVGTGDTARREIVARLKEAGWRIATFVHPRAHLAPTTKIGEGVLIGPGVVVGAYSTIGDNVVVGRGVLIGHHTEVGSFATLGPGANVAGNVRVEHDAFLGMGAVVRDHVTVGASSVVAMGAVVVGDVPERASVRGVPAREG
jgi:sugar O-acyltransferase (sialic acid O-acetyltransferase NeuD family)